MSGLATWSPTRRLRSHSSVSAAGVTGQVTPDRPLIAVGRALAVVRWRHRAKSAVRQTEPTTAQAHQPARPWSTMGPTGKPRKPPPVPPAGSQVDPIRTLFVWNLVDLTGIEPVTS